MTGPGKDPLKDGTRRKDTAGFCDGMALDRALLLFSSSPIPLRTTTTEVR